LRTDRSRKTEIGTEVAHVTPDSDTTFKVKRSKSPGRFTHPGVKASGSCSGERYNVLNVVTYCYVAVSSAGGGARRFGAHRGKRGAGHIVASPTQLVNFAHTSDIKSFSVLTLLVVNGWKRGRTHKLSYISFKYIL